MLSDADRQTIFSIPLFADLDANDHFALAAELSERTFVNDEQLFAAGEDRHYLRIILSGRVDLLATDPHGNWKRVISYGRGDILGEGVLLDGTAHTMTAVAAGKARVAEVDRNGFSRAFTARPGLEARVLRGFVRSVVARVDQIRHAVGPEAAHFASGRTRSEHDLLGDLEVSSEAYYGVQTARARDNFNITGTRISRYGHLIRALAVVKMAAAKANVDSNNLSPEKADFICRAAQELVNGRLHDHFVVDVLQGGAGTSTNMNANEVIANRALELMGFEKGDYQHLHPNNDVNRAQSTNDAYPTALKLAMYTAKRGLVDVVKPLVASFRAKASEFAHVVKMGRTQLQDAVPMTLGQEFAAYAASLEQEVGGLETAALGLLKVNMGGTAIGTGLNAPAGYAEKVVVHLAQLTGLDIRLADDLIEATQDTQAFVVFSSALKSLAIKLSKISNDLRLLSSGPRAGLGEINLPARQPGSSIMPGKVNPVIPEVVNQVAYRVIGNDLTVTMGAEAGQLELNVMEPVIAAAILDSIETLTNAVTTFRFNCVEGITANEDQCRAFVERSIGVVTALVPVLGYEVSTKLAADALRTGQGIVELVRERGLLDEERIRELLSPENMLGARPR
ncbi:MAG: aspartate ammonia-lyase [Planctomycetota bacterium]